jgi:ElaB/YqjD/DUF883 family membrane-anchored ribosome-binding protein
MEKIMRTNNQLENAPFARGEKLWHAKNQLASDFNTLVSDAEQLLQSTANYSGETISAARDRFQNTLEHFKGRVSDAQATAVGTWNRAASATDGYVHENPWRVIGVVAAVGLLVALLLPRK